MRPRLALAALATLIALAVTVPASAADTSSTRRPAATTLALASQTSWVTGPSFMRLGLVVHTPVARSDLGVKLVIYSCLSSRSAFDQSLSGTEPSGELVLDAPATIPLTLLSGTSAPGHASVEMRVVPGTNGSSGPRQRPTISLECAAGGANGVYPLEVVLVDTRRQKALASFTTHIVYAAATQGTTRLRAAIVLPLGATPALAPSAATNRVAPSNLSPGAVTVLNAVSSALVRERSASLSLEIFPQLLVALSRAKQPGAVHALAELRALVTNNWAELLPAAFADVNPVSLSASGLLGQLTTELNRAKPAFASLLKVTPKSGPFVIYHGLDAPTLALLESVGVRDLVLPQTSYVIAAQPQLHLTQTAPFVLEPESSSAPARTSVVAFGADPGLAAHFAPTDDPVLAAHQLLAELAQIYFDRPGSPQPRGVVIAPATWQPNPAFIEALLAGLATSPIVATTPVSNLFNDVPIGANGDVAGATLAPLPNPARLDTTAIIGAMGALRTASLVVPESKALLASLRDSLLLAESAGLSSQVRASYYLTPREVLRTIGRSLSFGGGSTITLTEQHAKLPIAILSTTSTPVHGILELSSSELGFPPRGSSRALVLVHKDNPNDIKVTTRTSGTFHLVVAFVTPDHRTTLLRSTFVVRSTAVSGVAIGISLAALAVLLAWWLRSFARHRRRIRADRRASVGATGS